MRGLVLFAVLAGALCPLTLFAAEALQPVEARPGSNDALVEMGALGAPDTSGVGLLTSTESGMPRTMWQGTPRPVIDALLAKVPVPTRSRALQSLGRRVLLTEAPPPEADATSPNFLALRLRRLIALGDLESVVRISDELMVGKETSAEQQARAEALLLRGAEGDACLLARQMLPFGADLYWLKLDTYCKVRSGDLTGGEFNLSLIRDRDPDPVFFALYDRLVLPTTESAAPQPFDGSALALTLMRAAKALPPTFEFANGQPALLRAVALDAGGTSADARLAAAVDAAAYGAFPVDALRALFALQGFPPEVLADPARAAGTMVPARALALFYQAIAQAASPVQRVTLTSIAYRYAAQHDVSPVVIDLVRPLLAGIGPDTSFAPFAIDMTQACLAAGDMDGATAWFALIASDTPSGADPARLERLRAAMNANPAAPVADTIGVPGGLEAFEAAVAQGSVGEAILRALEAFGPHTPAQAGDAVVGQVASGLGTLQLTGDATAILREAALDPVSIVP